MTAHVLDNPLWASLTTLHRGVALGGDAARRFPGEVAPFLAVPAAGPLEAAVLASLVGPGETVFLIGPGPDVPEGWRLESLGRIAQLACEAPLPEPEGPEIVQLTERDREAVLALTALVYPHYFRAHTMELGRYFGLLEHGRLAAMVGERMGAPGFRELSAMCTHPDFVGGGRARRLLARLTNELLASGQTPFLHVSLENLRAKRLYEQNGYRVRAELDFWGLQRAQSARGHLQGPADARKSASGRGE